ncbi:MAG: hypothetical protein ACYC6Y_23130, partial [Thermoguttaceae bacterium]
MPYRLLTLLAAVTISPLAAIAAAEPELATIPDNLTTLHLALGSQGAQGQKQPTAWDGQLKVTGGRLKSIRLWQEDPRNTIDGA